MKASKRTDMNQDQSSAFTFNLDRCQFFGWWLIKSESAVVRFAYGLYRFLSVSWLIVFTLLQLIDLYEASTDLEKLSTNLCGTSVSVVSVFKTIQGLRKAGKVESLQRSLSNNFYLPHVTREKLNVRILQRSEAQIRKLSRIFFGLVIPTIFGWSVVPFLDESMETRFPLRLWLPFEWDFSPLYELLFAYEVISLWLFAVNILTQDLIIFGFIIQICSQYEILHRNLQELNKFCREESLSHAERIRRESRLIEIMKKNIAHHQEILRKTQQIQTIYGKCFLVHFSAAIPLICVIGFNIIKAKKGTVINTLMMIQIGYVGSTLFDIYMFCAFGERLKQEGLRISETIYESCWYGMGPVPRKMLMVIMMRAQKSPELHIGGIAKINLPSLLQILQTCYNILAVMIQMSQTKVN